MNKETHSEIHEGLRQEYDLSQLLRDGVRGKYVERFRAGYSITPLTGEADHACPDDTAPSMTGAAVRMKADLRRRGVLTGKTRARSQRIYRRVTFPGGPDFVLGAQLELASENPADLLKL